MGPHPGARTCASAKLKVLAEARRAPLFWEERLIARQGLSKVDALHLLKAGLATRCHALHRYNVCEYYLSQ